MRKPSAKPFAKTILAVMLAAGIGASLALWTTPLAQAAMQERDYLEALKIAQKKVERTQNAASNARIRANARLSNPGSADPNALSSAIIVQVLGRYYRVGDSWYVAATQFDPTQMRMTSDPASLRQGKGRTGIFKYEVIEVKNSPAPEATLRVTQVERLGFKPVDARVEALSLSFSDTTEQTRKAYHFPGRRDSVAVAPDGLRASLSILELFPLDVPEISTAEAGTTNSFPALPAALAQVRAQAGASVELGQSLWFEQDDFFGRSVQILWQKGDPWPAYLKTANGTAILIRVDGGNNS